MKSIFKRVAAFSLVVALAFALSACKKTEKTGITLAKFDGGIEIHTEAQLAYLNGTDPAEMDEAIDGKHEYSRPLPVTLTWKNARKCEYYSVELSSTPDFSNAVMYPVSEEKLELYNLLTGVDYYWRVKEAAQNGVTSETGSFFIKADGPRNLFIEGVTNVRDLGGYSASNKIKQGLIYRGGRLNNSYSKGFSAENDVRDEYCVMEPEITVAGAKVFAKVLGIKTEIDLRNTNGNGYPGGGLKVGGVVKTEDQAKIIGSAVNKVLGENLVNIEPVYLNGSGALLESNITEIKKVFDILAQKDNYPVYFHCNIGTNRTGMIAFLLGAICGVEEADLYRDYMFSNFGTIALRTPVTKNDERTSVKEMNDDFGNYIKACAGDTIKEKAENCLTEKCGVTKETIEKVRSILLGEAGL